jgi:recombinational DNA repair protein RecT
MARKTVVRRILKYVPASTELQQALDYETEAERAYPVPEVYALSPMERQSEMQAFENAVAQLGQDDAEKVLGRPLDEARQDFNDHDIMRLFEAVKQKS